MPVDTRVIMICLVLEKETYVIPRQHEGSTLIIPPDNFDTTMSHNSRVLVKYNDNEFYPLYFVYYRRRPEHRNSSRYSPANRSRVMAMSHLWLEDAMEALNMNNHPYGDDEPAYFSDTREYLQSLYDDDY